MSNKFPTISQIKLYFIKILWDYIYFVIVFIMGHQLKLSVNLQNKIKNKVIMVKANMALV